MSPRPATRLPSRLGSPLGTGRDWRRRLLLHHVPLALTNALALVVLIGLAPSRSGLASGVSRPQLTVATGDLALGLLGLTLLVGPVNLLLGRRNPVSSYLRRDLGAWTAIASIAHMILSLQHGRGVRSLLDYFVADDRPLTSSFVVGNWLGLVGLVIVVGLLALSTDRSLRELKARRWKRLQRLNHVLFALAVVHAFMYGALGRMTSPRTLLLFLVVAAVLAGQAVGIRLWRRKHSRGQASRRERGLAGAPS